MVLTIGATKTGVSADGAEALELTFANSNGELRTFSTAGSIDFGNPFFQPLGANGRTCATCHQPSDGWSVTPAHIQARFDATGGIDPIFRTNDGANCDTEDTSTVNARRSAYSLLLNKGLIRIVMSVPADAEFAVTGVDNPYGCGGIGQVSVYRRPLPSTNLRFLSTVMWDGRESFPGNTLIQNLMHQANTATQDHAQANHPLSEQQREQIAEFDLALFAAQATSNTAGPLNADGAQGGPQPLSRQTFFIGINDPLGNNPTGVRFTPEAFDIFSTWENPDRLNERQFAAARESIGRGQRIFNTRAIRITGVAGLNDALNQDVIAGTCTTCHDSPNVGDHSVAAPLDIGVADASRRTPDLPLITLINKKTNELKQTTDPGRALVSGRWEDIGKIKGPILRGLSARAPYFHNGSAATLMDVVKFYDERFDLSLTQQEKEDLVAFLSAL